MIIPPLYPSAAPGAGAFHRRNSLNGGPASGNGYFRRGMTILGLTDGAKREDAPVSYGMAGEVAGAVRGTGVGALRNKSNDLMAVCVTPHAAGMITTNHATTRVSTGVDRAGGGA